MGKILKLATDVEVEVEVEVTKLNLGQDSEARFG